MTIVERISSLHLHDVPVRSVRFSDKPDIKIGVSFYNEEKHDYDNQTLIFKGVNSVKGSEMDLSNLKDLEIADCDVNANSKNSFTIKFVLLTTPAEPSWEISFDFSEFEIEATE